MTLNNFLTKKRPPLTSAEIDEKAKLSKPEVIKVIEILLKNEPRNIQEIISDFNSIYNNVITPRQARYLLQLMEENKLIISDSGSNGEKLYYVNNIKEEIKFAQLFMVIASLILLAYSTSSTTIAVLITSVIGIALQEIENYVNSRKKGYSTR